jgi:hypothetical protein
VACRSRSVGVVAWQSRDKIVKLQKYQRSQKL